MNSKLFFSAIFVSIIIFLFTLVTYSQELKSLQLPPPQMSGGKPLMEALKKRESLKSFNAEKIPLQILSNLLWAAWGINRPDIGKRTAPSGRNEQEIDLYVVISEGVFLYDAKEHSLKQIVKENLQTVISKQQEVIAAPVNLVFVADYARMAKTPENEKDFFSAVDTGYISQNVYLFCASEGLSTFAYYGVDRPILTGKIKLRPGQKIILGQAVGCPAKAGN